MQLGAAAIDCGMIVEVKVSFVLSCACAVAGVRATAHERRLLQF